MLSPLGRQAAIIPSDCVNYSIRTPKTQHAQATVARRAAGFEAKPGRMDAHALRQRGGCAKAATSLPCAAPKKAVTANPFYVTGRNRLFRFLILL